MIDMKIIIRKRGHIGFPIIIPHWLFTNKSLIRKFCNNQLEMNLTEEEIKKTAKDLKKCKKVFNKLELISVESADGEIVKIYL